MAGESINQEPDTRNHEATRVAMCAGWGDCKNMFAAVLRRNISSPAMRPHEGAIIKPLIQLHISRTPISSCHYTCIENIAIAIHTTLRHHLIPNFQTGTRDPRYSSSIMASFRGTISKYDHKFSGNVCCMSRCLSRLLVSLRCDSRHLSCCNIRGTKK